MTIKTPETIRQLAYAKRVAEKLSDIIAEQDDDKFDPVAFEVADGLVRRIEHAIDMLDVENETLNRKYAEEEAIHSAAKRAKDAAKAMCDFGYAIVA